MFLKCYIGGCGPKVSASLALRVISTGHPVHRQTDKHTDGWRAEAIMLAP